MTMTVPETRRAAPYDVRMLAVADRLFTDFDQLPVRSVFTAIATANATVTKQHSSPLPDPDQVEQLAQEQLRGERTPNPL